MSQIIQCPKCNTKSWSSDYWTCTNCNYSESREWVLLEENKEFKESYNKGDNPALNLNFWMDEQEKLAKTIIKDCLPNRNIEITFEEDGDWGYSLYYENDLSASKKAKERVLKMLNENKTKEAAWLTKYGSGGLVKHNPRSCQINISPQTLKTKYSPLSKYGPRGAGFLPTTTHESAHVSYEVTHHSNFKPWINDGHDEIWRNEAANLHDKMLIKHGEEINKRFKELEKIENKDK